MATQKHSYDNKDLYPFQADELHANVILSPKKNSGVKMQLTFCSLPCTHPKRKTEVSKMLQFMCSALGSENPTDSSDEGSRGDQRRCPSWDSTGPLQRCTLVTLLFRKQISPFALQEAHILFFSYKQGGLRKSRTDYL